MRRVFAHTFASHTEVYVPLSLLAMATPVQPLVFESDVLHRPNLPALPLGKGKGGSCRAALQQQRARKRTGETNVSGLPDFVDLRLKVV